MTIYTRDCLCEDCYETCEHYKAGRCEPGNQIAITICDYCNKVIPMGDYCLEYEDKHFCDDECAMMFMSDNDIVKQVVSDTE